MGKFWADPINHPETPSARLWASNGHSIHCKVEDPTRVSGTGEITIREYTFKCLVTFNREYTGGTSVGGSDVSWETLPARMTDNRRSDEAQAKEIWAQTVNELVPQALALLDAPDFSARVANIREYVEWDLRRKLAHLVELVGKLRREATTGLDIGARSTASMGNCEMEAAIAQACLAQAAKTYGVAFGPFVDADHILYALIRAGQEDGSIDFRVNTYTRD